MTCIRLSRALVRNSLLPGPKSLVPHRLLSSRTVPVDHNLETKNVENKWNQAITKAEDIVGYSTVMNKIDLQLSKLIGSTQPTEMSDMLCNSKNNPQGLLILLLSKAVGRAFTANEIELDKATGVLHAQRVIAEVTEMVRISFTIHQTIVNLNAQVAAEDLARHEVESVRNKIAILNGDFLFSVAWTELSQLRNEFVNEMFASVIRDMTEGEFIGDRDQQNNPLPARPKPGNADVDAVADFDLENIFVKLNIKAALGNPEREWTVRHLLSKGSLLGKACQSALILADQPKELQHKAYLFGKHSALAWQLANDLEPFQVSQISRGTKFSLVSAPLLYHLQKYPETYEDVEQGNNCISNVDFEKLHTAILRGPGLEKTKELRRKHVLCALKVVDELPNSDARTALQNIILAMQGL